uniref:C-X-C motif chemokine ligand 5 n=1 Tax=Nannospalax galili TaxID=1026970 RepID=A0A8C6RP88_NANGA
MSLLPRLSACIPGRSSSLLVLLAFLLLLTPQTLDADSDVSVVRELRCICMTITPKVSPTMITNLEVIARGQQCPNVQVIASLKNGKEVCLDPDAPLIKKIIKKMLDSRNKKTKRNEHALGKSPNIQQ